MTPSSSHSTNICSKSNIALCRLLFPWACGSNPSTFPLHYWYPTGGCGPTSAHADHMSSHVWSSYHYTRIPLGPLTFPGDRGISGSLWYSMLMYGSSSMRIGSFHHCAKTSWVKKQYTRLPPSLLIFGPFPRSHLDLRSIMRITPHTYWHVHEPSTPCILHNWTSFTTIHRPTRRPH